MNYKNTIYLKSGENIEFNGPVNVQNDAKDVEDWTGGVLNLYSETFVTIPLSNIAMIETKEVPECQSS